MPSRISRLRQCELPVQLAPMGSVAARAGMSATGESTRMGAVRLALRSLPAGQRAGLPLALGERLFARPLAPVAAIPLGRPLTSTCSATHASASLVPTVDDERETRARSLLAATELPLVAREAADDIPRVARDGLASPGGAFRIADTLTVR